MTTMATAAPAKPADDRRPVTSPEGVVLAFRLASLGDRLSAVAADFALIFGMTIPLVIVAALSAGSPLGGWLYAFGTSITFLIRHFYFVWSELHYQGATWGKRRARIRVIDARGGPLTADAVFVRNVTRELELFGPLLLLFLPGMVRHGAQTWTQALALLWLIGFALMPFLNRDRKRVGDLLAGTVVVRDPRVELVADPGAAATRQRDPQSKPAAFRFRPEQLDMYGIRELQVLADLLRRSERHTLGVVCDKIKRKIAWDRDRWDADPEQFLNAFYPALRAHLEQKMLLGRRQEQKKAGRLRTDASDRR